MVYLSRLLAIWYNPNKDVYYYKFVRRFYQYYDVGSKNSFGHILVLLIPVDFKIKKDKLKKRLIKRLIVMLENI